MPAENPMPNAHGKSRQSNTRRNPPHYGLAGCVIFLLVLAGLITGAVFIAKKVAQKKAEKRERREYLQRLVDWTDRPETDEQCDAMYGDKYVQGSALRMRAACYTTKDRRDKFKHRSDNMLCFETGMLGGAVCRADWVLVQESPQNAHAAMQCRNINWKLDHNEEPFDYSDLSSYAKSLEERGVKLLDEEPKAKVKGKRWPSLFVKRRPSADLWEQILDLWQAHLSLEILRKADRYGQKRHKSEQYKVSLSNKETKRMHIFFLDDLRDEPTQGLWGSLTPGITPKFIEEVPNGWYEQGIFAMPGYTSPFHSLNNTNSDMPCGSSKLAKEFADMILDYVKVEKGQPGCKDGALNVAILSPASRIHRKQTMDAIMNTIPNGKFRVVRPSQLHINDQIRVVAEADTVVGYNSPEMGLLLFAKETASVAELFTSESKSARFRGLASLRGLAYSQVRDGEHDDLTEENEKLVSWLGAAKVEQAGKC